MKRTYIAPEALVIKMTTEDAILSLWRVERRWRRQRAD